MRIVPTTDERVVLKQSTVAAKSLHSLDSRGGRKGAITQLPIHVCGSP